MSQPFGLPENETACDHRGMWEIATVAGYGVMVCTGCGYSFFLKKVEGDLFWQEAYCVTAEELREATYAEADEEPGKKEEAA